jgi:Raf kinase inhibitor-like YbhB/YbcL family protein
MMTFKLTSREFSNHDAIPSRFSGEAENLSPALSWSGVPADTEELVLICQDPDAPQDAPFIHWLLYAIPPTVTFLPEGITKEARLVEPLNAFQGRNSAGDIGYTGPMPPVGEGGHHYFFTLFALNEKLDLPAGISKRALLQAMRGKVIASAELIGLYERNVQKQTA